jgi:hypothetical protein
VLIRPTIVKKVVVAEVKREKLSLRPYVTVVIFGDFHR